MRGNKNRTYKHIFVTDFAGSIIILSSCTFEITGENYVEVSPEPDSELNYDITSLEDSLLVLTPKYFDYKFSVDRGYFFGIKAYVDGEEIYSSGDRIGKILIDPFDKKYGTTGYHEFVVDVYTSTNTKSLADQVGGEAIVYELVRTIEIDRHEAVPIQATFIEEEDGVRIEFGDYPHKNLKSIAIYSSYDKDNLFSLGYKSGTVIDPESGFEDTTYIGGTMYFGVVTSSYSSKSEESLFYSEPVEISVKPAPQILAAVATQNGSAEVSWLGAPYARSFDRYEIDWGIANSGSVPQKRSLENFATLTTILDDLTFNKALNVSLKGFNKRGHSISSTLDFSIAESFMPFSQMESANGDPSYLAVRNSENTSLMLFKDDKLEKSIPLSYASLFIDPTQGKAYVGNGRNIKIFSIPALTLESDINLNAIYTSAFRQGISKIRPISEGRLLYYEGTSSVFDLSSLTREYSNFFWRNFEVSSNTQEILVLERNGTDRYLTKYKMNDLGNSVARIIVDPAELKMVDDQVLLLTDAGLVEIREKENFQLSGSYSIKSGDKILDLDQFSRSWLVKRGNKLVVVDALDGQDVLAISYVDSGQEIRLINKKIYSSQGLVLSLVF